MEISAIDDYGMMTIVFQDEMRVIDDINRLKRKESAIDGELKPNMEIFIDPFEG